MRLQIAWDLREKLCHSHTSGCARAHTHSTGVVSGVDPHCERTTKPEWRTKRAINELISGSLDLQKGLINLGDINFKWKMKMTTGRVSGNSTKSARTDKVEAKEQLWFCLGRFFIPSYASLFFRPISPGCTSSGVHILLRSTTFPRKMVSQCSLALPGTCRLRAKVPCFAHNDARSRNNQILLCHSLHLYGFHHHWIYCHCSPI